MNAHVRDYRTRLTEVIESLENARRIIVRSNVVDEDTIKQLREIIDDIRAERRWERKKRGDDPRDFAAFLNSLVVEKGKENDNV